MHQQLKSIHKHILQFISLSQTGSLGGKRGGVVGEGGWRGGNGRGEDNVHLEDDVHLPDDVHLEDHVYLLRNLSYSNVVEAWVLVASRAFYVSRRTKHTKGTNGLGVARDHAEGEEGGQGVSEGGRGKAPRQGRLLMVPLLDMINHCAPRAGKNPPPRPPPPSTNQRTSAGGDGRDVGGSVGGGGRKELGNLSATTNGTLRREGWCGRGRGWWW